MAGFRPEIVESGVQGLRNAPEGRISPFGPFREGNALKKKKEMYSNRLATEKKRHEW